MDELSFENVRMDDTFGQLTDLLTAFWAFGLGPFKMLNTSGAVVLGMVYNYLPYMILPLYTVMEKIDKSVIEAAHDLGCNNVKTMFKVVVPLSMPGIMSGITMVFGAGNQYIYHFKNAWRRF